jgi:RNA polymerase sigma-70 factor, ECF subfamily
MAGCRTGRKEGAGAGLSAHVHSPSKEAPAANTLPPDERSSFEAFYVMEFARVERFAAGLVGERDALDVAQESFVRTWTHWQAVSRGGHPLAYTLKVACNLARSAARHRAAWERIRHLVPRSGSREEPAIGSVSAGLSDLPIRQRQALLLCDLLGFTSEEAGHVLQIAPSTVRVHVARARAALRKHVSFSGTDVAAGGNDG